MLWVIAEPFTRGSPPDHMPGRRGRTRTHRGYKSDIATEASHPYGEGLGGLEVFEETTIGGHLSMATARPQRARGAGLLDQWSYPHSRQPMAPAGERPGASWRNEVPVGNARYQTASRTIRGRRSEPSGPMDQGGPLRGSRRHACMACRHDKLNDVVQTILAEGNRCTGLASGNWTRMCTYGSTLSRRPRH